MRHTILILIALVLGTAAAPALPPHSGDQRVRWQHPGDQRPPMMLAAAKTGKERLTDKGSDEQRLNDCKVPRAQRTKARPANCRGEH